MRKATLMLTLICSISIKILAQEPISVQETEYADRHSYYFGIVQRIGSISRVGGAAPEITVPFATTLFEFKIPISTSKSYFYTQIRVSIPLMYSEKPFALLLPIINMEAVRLGGGFGFGGTVFDVRGSNNIGWLISVNGAIIVEAGVHSHAIPNLLEKITTSKSIENQLINAGFEFNMRASYTIRPHLNFILGADFGYLYAIGTGDPFYVNMQKTIASFHTLTYALSFGLGF
ncbi:MAG: hypothetical protein ACRCTJ_02065 [Brevinema sp.]